MSETSTAKNRKNESKSAFTTWPLIEKVLTSHCFERILLHGPPGVGKTYCAYTMGRIERGVYACTLTQELPASELRGSFFPRGNEFVWRDGPVIAAMRAGARLVLNEITKASDDALTFLYPILENAHTARITLPSNETVMPAPGFTVVATDNEGPESLPAALRDRFDALLEVREPHPGALMQLSPPLREVALRGFALDAERRVSLRSWLVLDRAWVELGLTDACRAVFGSERGSQIYDALILAGAKETKETR